MKSVTEAAHELGLIKSTVSRTAKRIGVGAVVAGRLVGLSDKDIAAVKAAARSPGNPNMVAGSKHQRDASKAAVKANRKRRK